MRVIGNRSAVAGAAVAGLLNADVVRAISLSVDSTDSIRNAASQIAYDMVSYYTGNDTGASPGLLPGPYYWWEAGAMWGGLINYWHYTNDATYNDITSQALLANIGPADDFIVPAQQFDEGNDDQSFWGMSAMLAAETSFPAPPSPNPSWIELAEAMWNTQVYRWDTSSCNGGLKWQIYTSNAGYDYKNSISNGAFFQMAARLLRSTGNTTYLDWAERSWDWSAAIGLVDPRTYAVYDGTDDTLNCSQIDHTLWSYNLGSYLLGAATMYNYTNGSLVWEQRTTGLIGATASFFSPYPNATSIMYEQQCETTSTCNADQQSFKAYLSSTMYRTSQMAPYTAGAISAVLRVSALGAAASCSGTVTDPRGVTNYACGSRWYTGAFDNVYGIGEQLSALEVIQGLLVNSSSAPIHAQNVVLNTTAPAVVTTSALATPSGTLTPIPASSSVVTAVSTSTSILAVSVASAAASSSSSTAAAVAAAASASATVRSGGARFYSVLDGVVAHFGLGCMCVGVVFGLFGVL